MKEDLLIMQLKAQENIEKQLNKKKQKTKKRSSKPPIQKKEEDSPALRETKENPNIPK